MAGWPNSAARSTRPWILQAPSSSEYSEWTWRWTAGLDGMKGDTRGGWGRLDGAGGPVSAACGFPPGVASGDEHGDRRAGPRTLRTEATAPRPGRRGAGRRGRARHPRGDVDRLREVRDLPARRADDSRPHARDLAPDLAPARPGGDTGRGAAGRGVGAERLGDPASARGAPRRAGERRPRVPLPSPRAARARGDRRGASQGG